jgi:high-affinity iron transporter
VLPFFVIGLREGLEASLIIGIIATFLNQQQRRDALRWMWAGVSVAIMLCSGVAVALRVAEQHLPQKQQEGLETVVGLLAVGMVTWMIIWMRQHARGLKHDLEGRAAVALAAGSVTTLVVMAFLAVMREGFETAVFVLAAFQSSRNQGAASTGVALGLLLAIAIGYGIYRGGVKLNLDRFFRITGAVLVFVAAGLLATAAHTGHEAGWINFGQTHALNLTSFVDPGSVRSALLTGMLGIQTQPVVLEVLVYVLYALPMTLFVLWPRSWRRTKHNPPPPRPSAGGEQERR